MCGLGRSWGHWGGWGWPAPRGGLPGRGTLTALAPVKQENKEGYGRSRRHTVVAQQFGWAGKTWAQLNQGWIKSAEMGVHSPNVVPTVYSTVICSLLHKCSMQRWFKPPFKHPRRRSSDYFWGRTKSLVLGLLQGSNLCVSAWLLGGSCHQSTFAVFLYGLLAFWYLLLVGKPIRGGAITQHCKLVFLTIMFYFFGVKNTLKQMCSYGFIKLLQEQAICTSFSSMLKMLVKYGFSSS